jgi:hypothetical protein
MGRRRKGDNERCMIVTISLPPECYQHASEQFNFSGYVADLIHKDMNGTETEDCIVCKTSFSKTSPTCPKCYKRVTKEILEKGIMPTTKNINERLKELIEIAILEKKEKGVEQ